MDLFKGVKKLILKERAQHAKEIAKLDAVLSALGSKVGTAKRTLSAEARERIAAAQRARWAKVRAKKKS